MTRHRANIDPLAFDVALAQKQMTRVELARHLGHPPSTLSSWLRGIAPPPTDLVGRIERVLELKPGSLALARRQGP
jgi:hypothetical protein